MIVVKITHAVCRRIKDARACVGKGRTMKKTVSLLLCLVLLTTAVAEQAGIDAAALKATFDAYNEMAAKGEDTQYGKAANYMIPLTAAPYYMVKIYPASWGSMGGVKTDIDTAAVLRADGTAIPGLYAAGEMSNRDCYNEVYYGAASLTVYSNMGRRAGIAAAAYAK